MTRLFKILIILYCIFNLSCSNITPLYNSTTDYETHDIIGIVKVLPIEGRYGVILRNKLDQIFGKNVNKKSNDAYNLLANVSVGSSGVQSFNSDGSASRLEANVSVSYILYDKSNCQIFSGGHSTKASFNSKSGGYDYGNIASEKAAIERNIEYNVNNYFPQIYNAIKFQKPPLPFVPPYLSINGFRGCR